MAQKIYFRRGDSIDLQTTTLGQGEPGFCLDTGQLYVGNGTQNILIGSTGGGGSLNMQDFSANDAYGMTAPLDVKNLSIKDATKTTITLYWRSSKSSNVKDYTIYDNTGVLIANTVNTTYQITGLTAATGYSFIVKTRDNNNVESNGLLINGKTNGNFALSITPNKWMETPTLTFSIIEMVGSITPKAGSWNNVFVDTKSGVYKMTTQYDGVRTLYTPSNPLMGVMTINNGGDIPQIGSFTPGIIGSWKFRGITIPSSTITDSMTLLGFQNGAQTDMTAVLTRVRFWKYNELGLPEVAADYDLSYNVTGTTIPDISGYGNQPLILRGAPSFIAN